MPKKRIDPARSPAVRLRVALWRRTVVRREIFATAAGVGKSLSALAKSELTSPEVIDDLFQMHWSGGYSPQLAADLYLRFCMPHRFVAIAAATMRA